MDQLTMNDADRTLTWPTASRFTDIWNGRRAIRNWWWAFPIAALLHTKIVMGWDRPRSIGNIPIRLTLRSGHRISCRANEIFQIVEVFITGDYENPEIPFSEARTILDVGANIGVATIWFSEHCPLARIFAVEPSSEASARLLRNINRNGLENRVSVLTVALGEGGRPLYLVFGEHSGLSHTDPEPHDGSQTVWSADLKAILEIVGGHVDVMKLDCEGAEYDIILGADSHTLSQIDHIVGEYHGPDLSEHARLFSRLEKAGFKVSHQGPSQPSIEVGTFSAVRVAT
jgi:FkbM family methyltransferase